MRSTIGPVATGRRGSDGIAKKWKKRPLDATGWPGQRAMPFTHKKTMIFLRALC
jgi:hypothetical protein